MWLFIQYASDDTHAIVDYLTIKLLVEDRIEERRKLKEQLKQQLAKLDDRSGYEETIDGTYDILTVHVTNYYLQPSKKLVERFILRFLKERRCGKEFKYLETWQKSWETLPH